MVPIVFGTDLVWINNLVRRRVQMNNNISRVDELSFEIVAFSRNGLSINLRFMYAAFGKLNSLIGNNYLETDGITLYHCPIEV